jgi:hypothetical protein
VLGEVVVWGGGDGGSAVGCPVAVGVGAGIAATVPVGDGDVSGAGRVGDGESVTGGTGVAVGVASLDVHPVNNARISIKITMAEKNLLYIIYPLS